MWIQEFGEEESVKPRDIYKFIERISNSVALNKTHSLIPGGFSQEKIDSLTKNEALDFFDTFAKVAASLGEHEEIIRSFLFVGKFPENVVKEIKDIF